MSHEDIIYYKIKFTDLIQEWVDASQGNNISSLRLTNHALLSDKFIMLKFHKSNIPVSLYIIEKGNELTQSEALAEIEGSTWQ